MDVLDLFCGAGGLSVGFERVGCDVVAAIDSDEQALQSAQSHITGDTYCRDIAKLAPSQLPVDVSSLDVIVGGPPCKDFSKVNQQNKQGRNNLVLEYLRWVESIAPNMFVIENVQQMAGSAVLEEVMKLDEYTVRAKKLDAADYGVPQHRIRLFVIGVHDRVGQDEPLFPAPTHGPDSTSGESIVTAGEALAKTPTPQHPEQYEVTSKHADLLPQIPPGMDYRFYTERLGHPDPRFEWRRRFSDFLYKIDPQQPVRTIKSNPGAATGPFHWMNRRLTERELEALHTFNTGEVQGSWREVIRQVGNAVPPKQAEALARGILSQLGGESVPLISHDTDLSFFARRRTPSEIYQERATERIVALDL